MDIYPNEYYVYFYLREDFTPYYVGQGKNKRAWSFHRKNLAVPKNKSRIIIVADNLSQFESLALERYYIRWFGRKDIGTGILRNLTEGGDHPSPEDVRRMNNKRVKNKTHNFLKCNGGTKNAIKNNEKMLSSGIHPFQKREDGSSLTKDRLSAGLTKNPFQRREDGSSVSSDRIKTGNHPFLEMKGTIPCYTTTGERVRISKEMYYAQSGPKETWQWAVFSSTEGRKRKISNN